MKRIIIGLALGLSSVLNAAQINQVVVFGDSLSDHGNLYQYTNQQIPKSPPYFEGRFSNGPVWIEQLMDTVYPGDAKNHVLNYAYGGASISLDPDDDETLFTLNREVSTYLLTHDDVANSQTLYVVWIGANNYLGVPDNADEAIKNVKEGIDKSLRRLANAGAKHVLVMNLPDLGKTPAAKEFDLAEPLSYLAIENNSAINSMVTELHQSFPDVQWISFDVFSMMNELMNYPEKYGFNDVTNTCYAINPNKHETPSVLMLARDDKGHLEGNCEGYLFFDLVHPTTQAHGLLAGKVAETLAEAGIEFTTL